MVTNLYLNQKILLALLTWLIFFHQKICLFFLKKRIHTFKKIILAIKRM